MSGRTLTNLLLAVIAGVLLFGRNAMLGGIKGVLIALGVIGIIWLILSLAGYLIRQAIQAWRDAKGWTDVGALLFVIAYVVIGLPFIAYAGWLRLEGTPHIADVVFASYIGKAWAAVMILLFAGLAVVGLQRVWRWTSDNWNAIPNLTTSKLRAFVRGYFNFLGGPVTLPMQEWRFRTQEGASRSVRVISAAYMSVLGIGTSLMVIVFTALAVILALNGLGIIS